MIVISHKKTKSRYTNNDYDDISTLGTSSSTYRKSVKTIFGHLARQNLGNVKATVLFWKYTPIAFKIHDDNNLVF